MGASYLEELQELAAADPGRVVRVIARLREPSQRLSDEELAERGLNVRRTFHLVPAISLEGPARAVAALAEEPWIQGLEEDREVSASQD